MTLVRGDRRRRFRAFGLVVASSIAFPELPVVGGAGDPDVVVRFGSVPPDGERPSERPFVAFDTPTEFTLAYDCCRVVVREGREVVVDPAPDAADRDVRWTILGPAFNFLMHQRGHLVLHGSAVAVDGRAVAVVGQSGAGKSTAAGAFLAAGHRALCDDVAAIRLTGEGPVVQPGFGSIKLHAEAAASVGDDLAPVADGGRGTEGSSDSETRRAEEAMGSATTADSTTTADSATATNTATATGPERATDPDERFYRTGDTDLDPVPLAAVYRLVDGDDVTVTPLPPAAAAAELGRNAYTVGTQRRPEEASLAVERSVAVSRAVPVATLTRPRRFDALPEMVRRVEREVRR